MESEGLTLPNVERAVEQILQMDDTSTSSPETLKRFLEQFEEGEKFFEVGLREINEKFSSTDPLEPMHHASDVLYRLSQNHLLALVTAGIEERQKAKMEKAGIELSLFSKIIVCGKTEKGVHYQELVREMKMDPCEVIVCGDRISTDLIPAKELGFTTIHLRQGRGRNEPSYHKAVDFSICQLSDLPRLVSMS